MNISCWPEFTSQNGKPIYRHIMQNMAVTDNLIKNQLSGDVGFIWSILWANRMSKNKPVWDFFRNQNKSVVVAEIGGLTRGKTWRLSANGITHGAIFPTVKINLDRPKLLSLNLRPWHTGDYILVCGQHGRSQQWASMPDMDSYYKNTVTELRKYTDRPIVIRSHPRYREGIFFTIDANFYKDKNVTWNYPKIMPNTYDDFDLDPVLSHAYCVVSHSSNAGLLAIIAGTPAIVSEHSLAYSMGTDKISDIENMPTPDRENWLIDLAHKEWLVEELPVAWNGLRNQIS